MKRINNQQGNLQLLMIYIGIKSSLIVAVISKRVHIATKSTFKHIFWLNLHSLGTFTNLMTNLRTIITDIVLRVILRKLLKQFFRPLKVLLHEYLGMIIWTFSSFLTKTIHIIPAQLSNYVFELASFAVETKSHIEVWTTLINVPERTVFPLLAFLSHKIGTNFEIVTKIALISIATRSHALEFVTRLDFTFIVGMGAVVRETTLPVDKFLADSIGGELVVIGRGDRLFSCCGGIVERVVVARVGALLLWVHYNNIKLQIAYRLSLLTLKPNCRKRATKGEMSMPRGIIKLNTYIIRMKQKRSSTNIKAILWLIFILATSIAIFYLTETLIRPQTIISNPRQLYTINNTRLTIVSKYCTSGAVTVLQSDRNTNSGYQSSMGSYMKANATRIVVALVNSNFGDLMTEIQINGTGTIVFIAPFFIGLFLLILAFPCLLCCCTCQNACPPKCCRGKNPNYSNSQLTWPTVMLILVCLLIIGTAIPSMTNSKSFFADFNCQAAKFLDDFYNGNPTLNEEYFFSGVSTVRSQLTTVMSPKLTQINNQIIKFNSSVGSVMGTVVTDTNNVLAGMQTVSKIDSTQFTQNYNYFLDSNTVSGTFSSVLGPLLGTHGANATLLGSLYTYIVNNILSNMTSITTAATSVSPHLNSGDMGAQITIADAALAVIQNNLDSMNSQFENVLSLLANIDSYNIRYAIIFYGVILGMASLILLIIIFMKCFKMTSCRHAIYFICFIMFFFCLLLFICTIILSILMPTLYYTCQYFQNTFTSPTAFTNMILTLQGASYTNLANQFAQCFGGTNGFMTAVNPTLQGYISQLKTAVFNSKLYQFTTMNTTVNSKLTTIKTAIDDTGLGRIPDFDTSTINGMTQIDNFDAIANKSTFSASCPQASFNIFYQDVWVPGLSATYQSQVECLDKVGMDNTTCTGGIANTATCPFSRCIDSFSIISRYYRTGNIGTIAADATTRYGSCPPFNNFLNNFYNSYVKPVVDNIGNTVDDGANTAKLAGRFKTNALIPINSLVAQLNGNVKTLFTQVYNGLTVTHGLGSIFDPSTGLITGLDCRLLSQNGVAARQSLCITSFNRIYFTLITTAILAFSLFLALCCIVCFNVRHYQKSIQKESEPGRIFPLDQTNSQIQFK